MKNTYEQFVHWTTTFCNEQMLFLQEKMSFDRHLNFYTARTDIEFIDTLNEILSVTLHYSKVGIALYYTTIMAIFFLQKCKPR